MKYTTKKTICRDISWLYFNHRVLQEAANPEVPPLERIRFLGIYSNNLDEFFKVRVATLKRLQSLKKEDRNHYIENPEEILRSINKIVKKQRIQFDELYISIVDELEEQKIRIINETEVNNEQLEFIHDLYSNKLVNSLSPVILTQASKFFYYKDSCSYLFIKLSKEKNKKYAILELPVDEFSRYIELPSNAGYQYIITLDDIVRLSLPLLLNSLGFHTYEAYSIKITRDSGMDFQQDIKSNLLEKVAQGVKNRYKGHPVSLSYDKEMPKGMLDFIKSHLGILQNTSLFSSGRYNNLRDLMTFPLIDRPTLLYERWDPAPIPSFDNSLNMAKCITQKDVYLHCPYHHFSYYIRFLREAAINPDVKAIKTTIYRLASNSKIVKALINAANNGKKVTVIVELMARFDEKANISWAQRLQEAGIEVIFGIEGLKIHSKLTYVQSKKNDIVCIGTGNFNEKNAAQYTDIFLFTSHKEIVQDVCKVFELIDHPYSSVSFKHLLVSPNHMRKKLYMLLHNEIKNAKNGKPAYLQCKINHITDIHMIKELYHAADEGVKIQLIVRGCCSMIKHKNIEIVSIVDKYLEHSRFFIFANGGNELYFISSADWMTRNLDFRIEAAMPVYDTDIQKALKTIISYGLNDNVKARIVDGKGINELKQNDAPPFRSQWELFQYHTLNAQLGLMDEIRKNDLNQNEGNPFQPQWGIDQSRSSNDNITTEPTTLS